MKTLTAHILTLLALLAAIPAGALAQHAGHGAAASSPSATAPTSSEVRPFDFRGFGSFRRISHTGDTSGQVKLADLPQGAGHWGMGALAGFAGEVLLYDGRLLVSRGEELQGRADAARPDDQAVLFAVGRVAEWRSVTLGEDMERGRFEAFVVAQAKALGLDTAQPFPFVVEGRYPALVWHVVTGAPSTPKHGQVAAGGHANKHSAMHVFDQPQAPGQLVGLYSGEALEGVVSHPGERFHVHFVDPSLAFSGHVDSYAVARGATLRLPVR
ncbi:MAG: acetolactate decarboxylase [Reyranella sp.]|nr:acetolactate decarboxylase [Reyranella sp.]MDP2334408.1 acetolactate decarboxylase [Reyranella sp.]